MTGEACINCVYLANDNKWCAEHETTINTPERSDCVEWKERKGEKARAAPASFLMREMEFEEYE